jgi:hypothetical protein
MRICVRYAPGSGAKADIAGLPRRVMNTKTPSEHNTSAFGSRARHVALGLSRELGTWQTDKLSYEGLSIGPATITRAAYRLNSANPRRRQRNWKKCEGHTPTKAYILAINRCDDGFSIAAVKPVSACKSGGRVSGGNGIRGDALRMRSAAFESANSQADFGTVDQH